jgi:SOS-response transcriptional repressor LexA
MRIEIQEVYARDGNNILSERERNVTKFILQRCLDGEIIPATLEIKQAMGFSSNDMVYRCVSSLIAKEILKREDNTSRTIQVRTENIIQVVHIKN